MTDILATPDSTRRGGWSVPVGSITADEYRACNDCGRDVNVLTVRTAEGLRVMADDVNDNADEDSTTCADCLTAMGPDE